MKRVITVLISAVLLVLSSLAYAQVPEKTSYQAIIRNANGQLVKNTAVGVKVSVLTSANAEVYTETHQSTTNDNGLLILEIGNGTIVFGNFSSIDWADDEYQISVAIDINGGTDYNLVSTQSLLSVPYALYAKNADNVDYSKVSNAPTKVSSFTNDANYLTRESQILSISNDTIFLTGGSFVKIPAGFDGNYNSLINKPNLATVATSGSYNDLSNKPDLSQYLTQESQILSISNDTIFLTGGSFVKVPGGFDGNYNSLTNKPSLATVATSGNYNDLSNKPDINTSVMTTLYSLFQNPVTQNYFISQILTDSLKGNFANIAMDTVYANKVNLTDTLFNVLIHDSAKMAAFAQKYQTLSMSNDTLFLTNGGYVVIPAGFDGDYNKLTNKPNIELSVMSTIYSLFQNPVTRDYFASQIITDSLKGVFALAAYDTIMVKKEIIAQAVMAYMMNDTITMKQYDTKIMNMLMSDENIAKQYANQIFAIVVADTNLIKQYAQQLMPLFVTNERLSAYGKQVADLLVADTNLVKQYGKQVLPILIADTELMKQCGKQVADILINDTALLKQYGKQFIHRIIDDSNTIKEYGKRIMNIMAERADLAENIFNRLKNNEQLRAQAGKLIDTLMATYPQLIDKAVNKIGVTRIMNICNTTGIIDAIKDSLRTEIEHTMAATGCGAVAVLDKNVTAQRGSVYYTITGAANVTLLADNNTAEVYTWGVCYSAYPYPGQEVFYELGTSAGSNTFNITLSEISGNVVYVQPYVVTSKGRYLGNIVKVSLQ